MKFASLFCWNWANGDIPWGSTSLKNLSFIRQQIIFVTQLISKPLLLFLVRRFTSNVILFSSLSPSFNCSHILNTKTLSLYWCNGCFNNWMHIYQNWTSSSISLILNSASNLLRKQILYLFFFFGLIQYLSTKANYRMSDIRVYPTHQTVWCI